MLFAGCLEQCFTRRSGLKATLAVLLARSPRAYESAARPSRIADLVRHIPPRPPGALTGSQFAASVAGLDRRQREFAIYEQLAAGNLPDFCRTLVPVKLASRTSVTIFVMPEYLAIGPDTDYLRIPMALCTAAAVAHRFRFLLPTPKMVDAIYDQSVRRFLPQPLPPGPQMTSTGYYERHNSLIDWQSEIRHFPPDVLVAGHKKDVVITNRLISHPGRIAIYGWHRGPGMPIQPLSTVHGAGYADYSHGIRLVARYALIQDKLQPLPDLLRDSRFATALSGEGPIKISAVLPAV